MTIYNVADILTGLFESIMMFSLYGTFCKKRENISKWGYAIGVIVLAVLVNVSNLLSGYGILNAVGMIFSFFLMSFLFKGNIPIKMIISVMAFLLMVIAEIMVLFGVTLVFNITVTEAVDIPEYRLLGIIASKMLAFLIINAIRFKYKDRSLMFKPAYWLLFFIIFSTSIVAEFLIFKLSYEVGDSYLYNLSIMCAFGLLFSTFFTFYLYEHLAKQAETIRNQEQYERHLKMQLKHLDDILIAQKQLKKFKHDFNNFQIGLQAYLDNNDIVGACKYLKDLRDKSSNGDGLIETGNTALDAILSTKIAIAKSKGIDVITKIQIPEDMAIEPIDMCIIFGNALDNAIEACERSKISIKKISVTIICRDEAVFCKVANTAHKPELLTLGTSKQDKRNHGFGLENIKTALAKYNASPSIERTDTEFTLKFVIFTK